MQSIVLVFLSGHGMARSASSTSDNWSVDENNVALQAKSEVHDWSSESGILRNSWGCPFYKENCYQSLSCAWSFSQGCLPIIDPEAVKPMQHHPASGRTAFGCPLKQVDCDDSRTCGWLTIESRCVRLVDTRSDVSHRRRLPDNIKSPKDLRIRVGAVRARKRKAKVLMRKAEKKRAKRAKKVKKILAKAKAVEAEKTEGLKLSSGPVPTVVIAPSGSSTKMAPTSMNIPIKIRPPSISVQGVGGSYGRRRAGVANAFKQATTFAKAAGSWKSKGGTVTLPKGENYAGLKPVKMVAHVMLPNR